MTTIWQHRVATYNLLAPSSDINTHFASCDAANLHGFGDDISAGACWIGVTIGIINVELVGHMLKRH